MTQSGSVVQPYTYTAREYDSETGLYYYRARYYDPKAGRFITRDPISFAGEDVNLYAYVWNNPVNLIDPDGLRGRSGGRGNRYEEDAPPRIIVQPPPNIGPFPPPGNPDKRAPGASDPTYTVPKKVFCKMEMVCVPVCSIGSLICPDEPENAPCMQRKKSDAERNCRCAKWNCEYRLMKVCE